MSCLYDKMHTHFTILLDYTNRTTYHQYHHTCLCLYPRMLLFKGQATGNLHQDIGTITVWCRRQNDMTKGLCHLQNVVSFIVTHLMHGHHAILYRYHYIMLQKIISSCSLYFVSVHIYLNLKLTKCVLIVPFFSVQSTHCAVLYILVTCP